MRTRKTRAAATALAALSLLACRGTRRPPRRAVARNLVLLCFDTVRADAFVRHDRPGAEDAFSAWSRRAVVYDDARTPAPWTLPAVASVMTGLYPARHNAGRFADPVANLDSRIPSPLPDRVRTLGQAASRAGLETAAFVSNPWVSLPSGVLRGFRHIERHPTRELLSASRKWLEGHGRSADGFFVYVHWVDAHGDAPAEEKRREAGELSPAEREALIASAPGATCRNPDGYRCIRYLSYEREIEIQRGYVAGLLETLQARGLLRDTLVVLFSDHGEEFGEHGAEERRRGADPRGFYGAGHGHTLYDEILRVPLLIWSPGERPRHDPAPVSLVDVAPTARQRLALDPVHGLDGRALPIGGGSAPGRLLFASGIAYGPEQAAVVDGDRKEIAISCPEQTLLFDERNDPSEKHPDGISGTDPLLEVSLQKYLAQRSARVVPMRIASNRLRAFRSLGYLRGPEASARRASRSPGPTTVGIYDRKRATFYLRFANAPGKPDLVVPFGKPGDFPIVGDWDGDGTTDLGVYRPSDRTFYIESRDGGMQSIAAGRGSDAAVVPGAGDWDGDGIDTPGIYDRQRGQFEWIVTNRSGSEWRLAAGGAPDELPVPGKWRCSGRSALGFYRSRDGAFHFPEPNVAASDVTFGRPGDLPLAGDWDGDGTVTIGVYRPETGTFFLRNSVTPGPADVTIRFGRPGTVPVVGRWRSRPASGRGPRVVGGDVRGPRAELGP